ncbi:helix-turn-helix domain-containing protein [Gillisia mitskevichiae]
MAEQLNSSTKTAENHISNSLKVLRASNRQYAKP